MNRFRKRSDTARSEQTTSLEAPEEQDLLPQLGLPNDFRTSLILPDLSRRFSLLRSSSGDLVPLDQLRSRLAEQRARGAENHISEEEEDMILETLRGIRSKSAGIAQKSQESVRERDDPSYRQSIQSTSTVVSSLPSSSPSSLSGRSAKRYSNNLFSSGRFRDYSYLRNATKNGSLRTQSLTPTESSQSYIGNTSSITDSLRPVTPDNNTLTSSTQSTPNERAFEHPASLVLTGSYEEQPLSVAEYRITKTLGPSVLKRASLALEEAIKELEEEAEDEIVMPRRSTPIPRPTVEQPSHQAETARNSNISQSSVIGAVAISSDRQVHNDPEERRASPVPSRILPGYIPGMPRPMTPRDFDPDDQRSHSTTPRATSPINATFTDPSALSIPNNVGSSLLRRDSTSSQSRPSPIPLSSSTSPLFIQRSTNGRQTPDGSNRDNQITEFDSPLNSSLLTRRRPASPLSGQSFQPLAVSSRPGTPSNVVWAANPSADQKSPGHSSHSRNDSWMSDGAVSSSDVHGALDRLTISGRSLRSPVLPDSPITGNGQNIGRSPSSASNNVPENRPSSSVSTDFHSPPRPTRSVTPTQNASRRSPVSPTFSEYGISSKNGTKRSLKQNSPSSPFNPGLIPPLVFSSLANSSRSSLASDGSSYHSWDGDKDNTLTLFTETDVPQPAWHDLSLSDKSSSATPGGSVDDDWDAEEIVRRQAGLRKSDFIAIQAKLVSAAMAKDAGQEGRERAPSSLRRRRPSTSQSNYSTNGRDHRVASPPPQAPASPISPTSDTNSKANALLRSMVDSIQHSQDQPSTPETTFASSVSVSNADLSPNTRRKRDLAQALFGREEPEQYQAKSEGDIVPNSEQPQGSPVVNVDPTPVHGSFVSPSSPAPLLTRKPSTPKVPHTPQEEAQLAREVQQKSNAATLALKKTPVNANLATNPYSHNISASRSKRITPNQISTPRLVSSSTSVETVPIPRAPSLSSANNSGPSRIGSRFKKLRGTLRPKNNLPTGDEITPFPLDQHSTPAVQTAHHDLAKLRVSGGLVAAASTTESRSKASVPSPPASAGPGLKGFMARLRGKQRTAPDTSSESDPRRSPILRSPIPPLTTRQAQRESVSQQPDLTPKPIQAVSSSATLRAPHQTRSTPTVQASHESADATNPNESTALQQLFDAATNLGLDQGALNDLLARSPSTSSRTTEWTMLTRNNSTMGTAATTLADSSRLTPTTRRPGTDNQSMRADTPDPKLSEHANGRHNIDSSSPRDESISGQPVGRKPVGHLRRPREGQNDSRAASAIIRRTIIYPSESRASPIDLGAVTRKNSNRRKRSSATSVSSRSVHDRAPTPPPPRSPTSKRFSNGPSPPVPNLPPSLTTQADNLLTLPTGGPIEKSNSTYDSLYEMYAGERAASSSANDPNAPETSTTHGDSLPVSEAVPAVEVIELANGQTIWSIVNGLRDDDDESEYAGRGSRASFTSEYSTRESEGGLQVFVKEHGRSGSKSSNSSFLARKKPLPGQQRPETKVFYSSSEQIGRLIENLSQGMDAGSFNFLPSPTRPAHSASSSLSTNDIHWTVEERLEHMLGSMRPS